MRSINPLYCCGWAELHGVQNYTSRSFHDVLKLVRTCNKGAYVFSSASRSAKETPNVGSSRLAKDIEKAGLGSVTALPIFRNPNTGRRIVPFMWQLDRPAFDAYCAANNIRGPYGF